MLPKRPRRPLRLCILAAVCAPLLAGCANGDFGEVQPYLVTDSVHDWVGRDTVPKPSAFPYTDDERTLRDQAYPLIEPPFDRQRWFSIAGEYGLIRPSLRGDRVAYANHLMGLYVKSPSSRYATLIDDIRNDSTRIPPFFETAGRVADMDGKRAKGLNYVTPVEGEGKHAFRRINENSNVIACVRESMALRADAYRFALERLVVEVPSPQAVEAERALRVLQSQVGHYRRNFAPTWQRPPSLASKN